MKKLTPYLIPLSLLVIALSIFSLDYESKMGSEPSLGATTKIKLTDPNSVTPTATSTPTAGMVVMASTSGYVDNSWINATTLNVGIKYVSSTTNLLISSEETTTHNTTGWTLKKQFRVLYPGTYKVTYKSWSANNGYARIYKNGMAYGSENHVYGETTYTDEVAANIYDTIELYLKCDTGNMYASEFRLKGDIIVTTTYAFKLLE